MAKVYNLYVGIVTALALLKSCRAEWNTTEEYNNQTVSTCDHQGNGDNCTGNADSEWNGHLSQCPEELLHYCIHGECRYVQQEKTPSCKCLQGYVGYRCQYIDVEWQKGDKRQILISCIIAGLISLIIFIVFIIICSRRRWRWCWHKGRRREEPSNGTENLSMMNTTATHTALKLDSIESPHTNSVGGVV